MGRLYLAQLVRHTHPRRLIRAPKCHVTLQDDCLMLLLRLRLQEGRGSSFGAGGPKKGQGLDDGVSTRLPLLP